MLYNINYGFGKAKLYTPSEDWYSRFHELASQCFGIRKSIGLVQLMGSSDEMPRDPFPGEYERLEYNGHVVVWNKAGEKIKSEWDF